MEDLTKLSFFQGDNKNYLNSSNKTKTYCGMILFTNWMIQNCEKILDKFLKE